VKLGNFISNEVSVNYTAAKDRVRTKLYLAAYIFSNSSLSSQFDLSKGFTQILPCRQKTWPVSFSTSQRSFSCDHEASRPNKYSVSTPSRPCLLRLFSDQPFSHWQYDTSGLDLKNPYFPWSRANPDFEAESYDAPFRYFIRSDETQKKCLLCRITGMENPRKTDLVKEYLFRAACSVDHPLAFFSAAERSKGADKKRVCIGHQGYVRL